MGLCPARPLDAVCSWARWSLFLEMILSLSQAPRPPAARPVLPLRVRAHQRLGQAVPLGLLPCIFPSCCLAGSCAIFLSILPFPFVSFAKCLSNIDSLPQRGLNAADGRCVAGLRFTQPLLPKSFSGYQLHPLPSALSWGQGLLPGGSWGPHTLFLISQAGAAGELFSCGLKALSHCCD